MSLMTLLGENFKNHNLNDAKLESLSIQLLVIQNGVQDGRWPNNHTLEIV